MHCTKLRFFIKYFLSKSEQIPSFLWTCLHEIILNKKFHFFWIDSNISYKAHLFRDCSYFQKRPPELLKKIVLRNFAKSTGKYLCQSLFFNKVADPTKWSNTLKEFVGTPMPKCDFNKVALQLYWNHTSAWVCRRIVWVCFYLSPFFTEHLWTTASAFSNLGSLLGIFFKFFF